MIDFETLVHVAADEMDVDVCSMYVREGNDLVLHATFGLELGSVGKVRMNIHEGLTGAAYGLDRPLSVSNPSSHPRYRYFPESGEEQFRSYLGIALPEGVGVLTFQTRDAHFFTRSEISAAEEWAIRIGRECLRERVVGPRSAMGG